MSPERTTNAASQSAEETEGERWLKILGEEKRIGTMIPYYHEGRQLRIEEFPLLDGYATSSILTFIESLPPGDPKREQLVLDAKEAFYYFLKKPVGSD